MTAWHPSDADWPEPEDRTPEQERAIRLSNIAARTRRLAGKAGPVTLRAIGWARGMGVADIAEALHISPQEVSRLEHDGPGGAPARDVAAYLAVLGGRLDGRYARFGTVKIALHPGRPRSATEAGTWRGRRRRPGRLAWLRARGSRWPARRRPLRPLPAPDPEGRA